MKLKVFFFRIVTERKSLSLFRFLLSLVFILDHYFPWGGAGRGFIVILTVNKQYILHIFQLQTQKRAPLSCGRSRRSCLRLWGWWRNETHSCLYWKSRDWRRGLRTGTWKASCSPRAMNSTGPRRMMGNTRRNKLTEQVYLSVFLNNLGDFIHNSFYVDYSVSQDWHEWTEISGMLLITMKMVQNLYLICCELVLSSQESSSISNGTCANDLLHSH